jgi:DNA-binding response OmpR family regulator
MQPLIPDAGFFPTLVFDSDPGSARTIAEQLAGRGVSVRVAQSPEDALRSIRQTYFRVLFVVADLASEECLRFLDAMRRTTPRSWLIVSNARVDTALRGVAYRHGGDALVEAPVDVHDLAERISGFQARSRPVW